MVTLHKAAKLLNVPITKRTDNGVALLRTISVDVKGISVGYQLPGVVHEIQIKGTIV